MKRYLTLLGVLAVVLAISAGYIYAQEQRHECKNEHNEGIHHMRKGPGEHMGMRDGVGPINFAMIERMKTVLELTEEQIENLKKLKNSAKEAVEPLMEMKRKFNEELRDELKKEILDEAKIKELAAKIKDAQSEMFDQMIKDITDARKILTSEQMKKLEEIREIMRERKDVLRERNEIRQQRRMEEKEQRGNCPKPKPE